MPSCASARRHRARPAECGVASLEFALVGSLLMSLLFGTIEIGRYLFTLESLRTAAAEAARAVTLRGSANMNSGNDACTGLSGDLTGVQTRTPFLDPSTLSLKMSSCATNGGVTTVTVTVKYPFSFVVPVFGSRVSSLTETAQAVFN
jgi:Flp pilus assembly protein TadG